MIGHNSKMTDEEIKTKTELAVANIKVIDLVNDLGTMIVNHITNYADPLEYGESKQDPMLNRVLFQIMNGMKASGWGREDALQMCEDKLDAVYGRVDEFGNPESEEM
jgi:hypothetical protein